MMSRFSISLSVLFFVAGTLIIVPLPSGGLQQTSSPNETIGRGPHAIAVGDHNGDGIPDVAAPAAAERKVAILPSNRKGGCASNHTYATAAGRSWVEGGVATGDPR